MSKITLTNLANLSQQTSVVNSINDNNNIITNAITNTLSRDGTSPNEMEASLDMNSNRILNLPSGITSSEPATVGQLNNITTMSGNVPAGGSTDQVLTKSSNTDYATIWKTLDSILASGLISSLTAKTVAPSATLDYLIIYDHLTLSNKKITPGYLLSSVSGDISINNTATVTIATGVVTNEKLSVVGPGTLKGNPGITGIYTGVMADISIPSLTFQTSGLIDTTSDKFLLWTSSNGGSFRFTTPAQLATALGVGPAAGVASIDGVTGVLTGYARHIGDNRMYGTAGNSSVTGASNTAFGYFAGNALTTGNSNTFIGNVAGLLQTSGSGNIGIGSAALGQNINGLENVAVGNTNLYNTRGRSPGYPLGVGYYGGAVSPTYGAITITLGSPGTINATSHGLPVGAGITFVTNGTLPSSFSNADGAHPNNINLRDKPWYISNSGYTANTFQIAEVPGGSSLQINGSQAGSHDYYSYGSYSGSENTAIGSQSMYSNTYGHFNTSLGLFALQWGELTSENTAIGNDAMISQTYGTGNTAVGGNALGGDYDPTHGDTTPGSTHTGTENTAIGFNAMLGKQLLHTTHYGYNNTAVGAHALYNHSSGISNTAVGWESLYNCNAGSVNSALGLLSLVTLTSGSTNIGIGYSAGNGITTGSNNVFIGNSGSLSTGITTGSGNVFLGNNLVAPSNTSNSVYIGDGVGNTRASVNSAGAFRVYSLTSGAVYAQSDGTLSSVAPLFENLGGTGQTAYAVGDMLYASSVAPVLSKLAAVATGNALISGGVNTAPSWGKVGLATHVSGTLTVPNGGTGVASVTAYSVLCGGITSTGAHQNVSGVGTSGQALISNGAGALPTWQNVAGSGTVNSGTAAQLAYYATSTNAVSGNANATISNGALTLGVATSVLGQLLISGNTSGTITIQPQAVAGTYNFNLPVTAGSSGQALLSGGGGATVMSFGTLGVAAGGTGITSGTSGGVPYFNGSSSIASSAALTIGQLIAGGGAGAAPVTVANGQLPATATNDNAAAGKVGENSYSEIVYGSAISLTTATATNVTSLSLTAGDWDVWGLVSMEASGSAVGSAIASISLVSNSLSGTVMQFVYGLPISTSVVDTSVIIPEGRFSLSGTTTVYLVGYSSFSPGAVKAWGAIQARRRR